MEIEEQWNGIFEREEIRRLLLDSSKTHHIASQDKFRSMLYELSHAVRSDKDAMKSHAVHHFKAVQVA